MHFCAAAAAAAGGDPEGVGDRGKCMWEVQSAAAAAARVAAVQFEVGGKLQVLLCRICKCVAAACATRSRNVKRARQQQTVQCIHIVYSLTTRRNATHGINLLHTLQQITALINMCGKFALLQQVSSKKEQVVSTSGGVTCPGKTTSGRDSPPLSLPLFYT